MSLSPSDANLFNRQGFYGEWFKLIATMTHECAYDICEARLENAQTELGMKLCRMYKNFESFRVAKTINQNRNGRN